MKRAFAGKGKISRLPYRLREQFNIRIHAGESCKSLLAWLNGQPEARQLVTERYKGVPISLNNLYHYRAGGYAQWLTAWLKNPWVKSASGETANETAPAAPDTADLLARALERFGYEAGPEWRRQRCAVLAAICIEHEAKAGQIRPVKLLRSTSARYNGLPLSGGKTLKLGPSRLKGVLRTWRDSAEPSPSVFNFKEDRAEPPPKRD